MSKKPQFTLLLFFTKKNWLVCKNGFIIAELLFTFRFKSLRVFLTKCYRKKCHLSVTDSKWEETLFWDVGIYQNTYTLKEHKFQIKAAINNERGSGDWEIQDPEKWEKRNCDYSVWGGSIGWHLTVIQTVCGLHCTAQSLSLTKMTADSAAVSPGLCRHGQSSGLLQLCTHRWTNEERELGEDWPIRG